VPYFIYPQPVAIPLLGTKFQLFKPEPVPVLTELSYFKLNAL